MNKVQKFLTLILGIVIVVFAMGVYDILPFTVSRAETIRFVQARPAQLYTSMSASSIAARLRSFKDLSGETLTMEDFGDIAYCTIDPGTTREEPISFTGISDNGDGTVTITGITRGLIGHYPYGTGGTAYPHYVNAYFVCSNGADFYYKFVMKDDSATITGQYTFSSTSLPQVALDTTDAQIAANGTNTLVTYNLLANTSFSGTVNGSETVKGIFEAGTALEQASSTATGGTGAITVVQTKYATSSPNGVLAALYALILDNAGKIAQSAFDFSQPTTWTGPHTFSGGIISSGVLSTASSTFTASTTFAGGVIGVVDVQIFSTTTLWTKPLGVSSSSMMMIELWAGGGGGGGTNTAGGAIGGGGGGGAYVRHYMLTSSATSSVLCRVGDGGLGGAAGANNGLVGENTVFGTYVTAYGGGGGGASTANAGSSGGGGGNTGVGATGAAGAGVSSGGGYGAITTGSQDGFAGGFGNAYNANACGNAQYGGGGGGYDGSTACSSVYGGGGGGKGNVGGGSSIFGGAGGAGGSLGANGSNGSYPSGGGGGGYSNGNNTAGGNGAKGKCSITTWK